MRFFPDNEEEISLIKFIAEYQYINVSDAKYFFKSSRYYRNRIKNLIDKNILRKIKWSLALDETGIEYCRLLNIKCNKLNRNKTYRQRLLKLSNIAAYYQSCETVKFIPSFSIKDKEVFTTTGRRYIGIFDINGFEYLTYKITKEHDNRYIASVIYDIQKETTYKNFIVLVDDINRINIKDIAFGYNSVLVIEDNEINREKLKYLHSIRWKELIDKNFKGAYLSEYNFCVYSSNERKYINTFYFIDAEKINRFKYFIKEDLSKKAYIICNVELEKKLKKEFPDVHYCVVDLNEYIDKEKKIYEINGF